MTKEQYQWLKDNGYDPAVYDIDEAGNVVQSPLAAVTPKPEVMSAPRAFGTSFLGSVIPSGAGLAGGAGAGALAGTLGAGPVGTVLGAIAGGLGAGYGAGKLQQKALEEFAPGALEELSRAETQQPVASYLGGFAPNVIAMKPSFKGISGLTAPLQSWEKSAAQRAFLPAAVNVGANVAGSTAGQLVNLAEGGEFSAPRFAADVALGSLFSDPTRVGRRMGFKPLTPEVPPAQRMDVGEARSAREQAAAQAADEAARVSDAEASARATELLGGTTEPTIKPAGEVDVRGANIERNRQNIARELERMSKQTPPEDLVQDLANDPFIPGEDPAALNEWLAGKADKYLAKAFAEREAAMKASPEYIGQEMAAGRERAAAFTPEGGVRVAPEAWMPENATRPPTTAEGVAAEQLLAEAKQRNDPQAIVQARQLADEIYGRLQRGGEEGQITQAQMDEAAQIAAKRGLRLEFADLEGGRGSFTLNTPDGTPLIRIDPMSATPDTAIHEIGHDVYARSANERMRGSLNDVAMGSEAYKTELAARLAEGMPQDQAHLLALEEGVVQAFGEKYPNVPRGEIKAWFNSLKASIKSMLGMKLSPEDSARWLYYATHEAVPWKGAVAVKTGDVEERLQRGSVDEQSINAMIGESVSGNIKPLVEAINLKYKDIINSTGLMPEMESVLGNYIERIIQEKPSSFDSLPFKVGDKALSGRDAYYQISITEPMLESLITGKPIEVSNQAISGYRAMVQGVINTMRELRVDNKKVENLKQLLDVFVERNVKYDPSVAQLNNAVKRWRDPDYRKAKQREHEKYNNQNAVRELKQLEQQLTATASRENPDIRLQRGISEIERLRRRGGIHSTIADNFDAAFNTRRFKEGEANGMIKEIARLNEAQREQLGRLLGQEFDQKRFINPPAELQAAYNEYRKVIQPHWVNEYNNQGMQIRSAAGLRGRQADPFYAPFHRLSDEAKTILTTQQGSPEYVKLQNDYIKQHTDYHLNQGKPLQDAQNAARADFSEEIAMRSAPYDSSKSGTFAGSRKAMGLPLPESWRSYDLLDNLYNYNRRSATDYAHQLHLEKSPETMAALGSKTMFNDQPIPPQVLATTPNLASDPSIQALNKNFAGAPMRSTDKVSAGLTRLVGATTIGTVSKAVEIPGTMISGLRYLQAGDYTEGLMSFLGKLASFADTQRRSYESGLNRRDGAMAMREVMGMADDASGFMNKAADVLSKATGLNALESAARTISQAWGETIVGLNKRRALGGDKEATAFLDTLSKDWRTRSDADLSAQVGRLLQGSYDLTQLPREFLESGAAPYLTWSKWSAGQLNSFMRFAVDPLMQGNAKPLAAHLLIGLLGGAAVGQIREWLNNREGRDINWKELEAWAQQNQGLGAEGYQQLGAKLMNIMQGVGTFGIAGDIVKMTLNAASGGTRQGIATAPAADAVFSTAERAAAALKALDDGEDFGRVMKALLLDSAKTHFQVARVAQNWIDEDENLAYNDRRRKRLYDELTNQSRPGVFTTSYSNLSERDFEKEVNPDRMAERAQELVKRAAEKSGDIETYKRELQKLKTQQNTIIPSMQRQPQKAARYLSWLEGAEEGRGADAYKRSLIREQEIKYRKALVEGFSGIR